MNPNPIARRTGQAAPYDRTLTLTIREGDAGTDDTIAAMIAVAQNAATTMREDLRFLFGALDIYRALDMFVDFKADPERVELVRHPAQMIAEIRASGSTKGDCDDRATLGVSAMLASYMPNVVLVVAGSKVDQDFQHVYCGQYRNNNSVRSIRDYWDRAFLTRDVYGIDPQERTPPGEHPKAARYRVYPVNPKRL
ncbi:MAG: hypothetical protein JSS51_04060 [Planctomycetes bacterium]|nr:hypothetical protein [Planctomycetota bacterium]